MQKYFQFAQSILLTYLLKARTTSLCPMREVYVIWPACDQAAAFLPNTPEINIENLVLYRNSIVARFKTPSFMQRYLLISVIRLLPPFHK